MILKICLLRLFFLNNSFGYSYSVLIDSSEIKDSVQTKYSDNKTLWGARLGFFPVYGNYVESAGMSETVFSETKISKVFNLGWSFQLNEVLGGNGGYLSLNAYLSHRLKFREL